jgi:hypothetical protein
MAISDQQKLDLVWKKIGYGVTKTDDPASKKAPNESIASPLIIRGDSIWQRSGDIPPVIPFASTSIIEIYNDALGTSVECVEDTTSTARRTWKTNLSNWIPTDFGPSYLVKVYVDDPNSTTPQSTGEQLFTTGSGNDDEWYFDYSSGVLHFIGNNLPSSVVSGKIIYVVGARYSGPLGVTDQANAAFGEVNANNVSASTLILENVLGTEFGGTGLSEFVKNGVLFGANSSTLSFATGTRGQILQISANGTPSFDVLDGGTYSDV